VRVVSLRSVIRLRQGRNRRVVEELVEPAHQQRFPVSGRHGDLHLDLLPEPLGIDH